MKNIVLKNEEARDLAYDDYPREDYPYEVVENKITSTGRWSSYHNLVIKKGDEFYATTYSKGLTESQDEQPFDYQKEVTFHQVMPVEKTIIEYVKVN